MEPTQWADWITIIGVPASVMVWASILMLMVRGMNSQLQMQTEMLKQVTDLLQGMQRIQQELFETMKEHRANFQGFAMTESKEHHGLELRIQGLEKTLDRQEAAGKKA